MIYCLLSDPLKIIESIGDFITQYSSIIASIMCFNVMHDTLKFSIFYASISIKDQILYFFLVFYPTLYLNLSNFYASWVQIFCTGSILPFHSRDPFQQKVPIYFKLYRSRFKTGLFVFIVNECNLYSYILRHTQVYLQQPNR